MPEPVPVRKTIKVEKSQTPTANKESRLKKLTTQVEKLRRNSVYEADDDTEEVSDSQEYDQEGDDEDVSDSQDENQDDDEDDFDGVVTCESQLDLAGRAKKILGNELRLQAFKTIQSLTKAMKERDADEIKVKRD